MIRIPDIDGLPVAVLGLGVSGLTAAKALAGSGAALLAWDDDEARREAAEQAGIAIHDLRICDWKLVRTLVLSPGIPHRFPAPHPIAEAAMAAGCEIVGDIELLGRAQRRARYIGITGTNGKSTTTALVGHILQSDGQAIEVGGNLGPPVLNFEPLGAEGTYVLEMSSYQLERTRTITFDVAVLLNISPDHLDRHGGLEGYIAAKRRIFAGQGSRCTAIVGIDDEHSRKIYGELANEGAQRLIPISSTGPVRGGVYALDGILYDDIDGGNTIAADLRDIATLPGAHNWQNAAAAYAAAVAGGASSAAAAASLAGFRGLPHRQEIVAVIDGAAYINDSKATNADAASKALGCYPRIYWIAGGQAKEGGIEPLRPYFPRIVHAYLIGEAAGDFAKTLVGSVDCTETGDLDTAVAAAHMAAANDTGEPKPTVLLSPACASFDQFPNFAARGEHFRALVEALPGTRGAVAELVKAGATP